MWMRFTERARCVVLLAQEEAGKMNSPHVGTEHLLLGLVRENEGVAAQVLTKMGISLGRVREEIEGEITQTASPAGSEPKLTPRAKRVLELAADEVRLMKHNYIGTEHLLLALIREKDGVAANVLRNLGLDLEKARQQVLEYLGPEAPVAEIVRTAREKAKPPKSAYESLTWMLPMLTRLLPRQLREMGKELRTLNKQKEIAILEDDYETAAILRDEANALEKRMEEFAEVWEEKMNAESLESSRETLSFVLQSLISSVEAALEALSVGDQAKIAEIKERLCGLLDATRSKEATDEHPDE